MIQQPTWWEWVDLDTPGSEHLKLLENAPDEIKKEFEEWQKQKVDEQANGIWK